jgi:hypothetical protein
MDAMDEIPREEFETLTDRGTRQIDNEIDRGQFLYWKQPSAIARSSGKRFRRKFIGIDAVLVALVDLFVERGLRREAVTLGLPGMQLVLPASVDRRDTLAVIAIRDVNRLSVGCGTFEELRDLDLFAGMTHSHSWHMPIAPAVERVRERAKRANIELPRKFAPSEPPLRIRGAAPAWRFSTEDGGTSSEWKPIHRVVQFAAVRQ